MKDTSRLDALKEQCNSTCGAHAEAIQAIDGDALKRAMVARHVQVHGDDSLGAALAAGPMKYLDEQHIAEIRRVQAAGGDPVEAAGADPGHVAVLQAADEAHAEHADELAQAYADFAAAPD